jgi:hypothetical protein
MELSLPMDKLVQEKPIPWKEVKLMIRKKVSFLEHSNISLNLLKEHPMLIS